MAPIADLIEVAVLSGHTGINSGFLWHDVFVTFGKFAALLPSFERFAMTESIESLPERSYRAS